MTNAMHDTARELVGAGRGILAADESTGTIAKRFDTIGLESTEENRRRYRDMLFATPGLGEHISGVILYDETMRQSASDGTPFTDVLTSNGMIPGIKVDTGAKPLALFPGETVTEGLDGLRERLAEYRELGARFAKWRAVITIGDGTPTDFAIHANAHAMARYAALCEEADIVPIVEPETLMDGDHDIAACEDATARTLDALYDQMTAHRIDLAGTLLKVNMIVPGKGNATQDDDRAIAEATIRTLTTHVPEEVPGVVFLSGGMSDEQATSRLNEMNRIGGFGFALSFSYGRALQAPSLAAWNGDDANVEAGQRALAHRARMNGLARDGRYEPSMESAA
ncbi:MAG TPA: class I fructose-bisphosphate aldolase [Actinomycetota bacterium]|nr:class I fructose-bisphosphate aldolase [Actinomycetota bacterium]